MLCRALLLFALGVLAFGCHNTRAKKSVNPTEAAKPHGEALVAADLSAEDQQKLATASGIVATPMLVDDLVHLIDKGSRGLNVYCLWKLNCPSCDDLLHHLSKLQAEVNPQSIAIHHINVDLLDEIDKVNVHIRALGLINNNYILTGLEDYDARNPYASLFSGIQPVLILSNNQDGTNLIYKQNFTYEELYAIIQPLMI